MALEEKYEFGTAAQSITADDEFSEANKERFLRIDLACGQRKKEGFIGVDAVGGPGVDIVHNLDEYPWPFKDNSVYEVHCSHYVEHVKDLVKFMNELHRIMMPLGLAQIFCPYFSSDRAWQDPTHVRAITTKTFYYFDKVWVKSIGMDHYVGDANFEVLSVVPMVNQEWQGRSDEAIRWAMKHYINVVDDLSIMLRKRE